MTPRAARMSHQGKPPCPDMSGPGVAAGVGVGVAVGVAVGITVGVTVGPAGSLTVGVGEEYR
jgi:hypothetical protein